MWSEITKNVTFCKERIIRIYIIRRIIYEIQCGFQLNIL